MLKPSLGRRVGMRMSPKDVRRDGIQRSVHDGWLGKCLIAGDCGHTKCVSIQLEEFQVDEKFPLR